MKHTHTHIYEHHIDNIYNSCVNKGFIETKMAALGARHIEVTLEEKTDCVTIEINREIPIDVPGMFKSIIKPWSKLIQKEVWKGVRGGPYYCQISIEVQNAPLDIRGTMKLMAHEGGTAVVSITEVNCTLPFIGKALSNFIGETSKKAIEQEFAYIDEYV
ncbi:MAG: DUF2505 domain-containing protein [Saprospiraceae bacterium]|nr:DUF2505 domain-containing protein [Saprospiraceae bacterium]